MPVRPVRGKSSPSRRKAGLAGSSHVSLPSEFPSAKKGINSFIEFLRNFQFHKLKLYKQIEIDHKKEKRTNNRRKKSRRGRH